MLRSGSMTVSPFSQRMMMGRSPRAVQFSSLVWPLMAMVVLGWEVIMAGTAGKAKLSPVASRPRGGHGACERPRGPKRNRLAALYSSGS